MIRAIILLLLYCTPAFSQDLFFNYRVEDRPFLNYYSIWNQFDSSAVMYWFGEVHSIHENVRQNAVLSLAFPGRVNIQDEGVEGVSSKLQGMARTENFTIPGAGEIRWFGQLLSFRTPCNPSVSGDEHNKPGPGWGVTDWTEFVIQLVDAESDVVLAVLDSVGVRPTAPDGPRVDTRYGNHPEQVKRSAPVPAGYTGKQVYVRVSPRRYGPTPYGLAITRFSSWCNLTAEWDSTGTTQIPLSGTEVLRDLWFAGLIDYCDSVKAATGWLPDLHGISFAKRSGLSIYHARYFTTHVDGQTGDTSWVEKHTAVAKRGSSGTPAPPASVQSIAPNPVTGETVDLELLVGLDMHYRLEVVSLDGRRLGSVWSGFLNTGQARLTVPIPQNLAGGIYILLLEQENGERVYQKTLVVAR